MNDSLSPEQARRLDDVCDRFEAACKAGQRPSPAAFVEALPEGERASALAELDALERAYAVAACPTGDETPPPADEPSVAAGHRVGDYEILGEIARGGMGVVYRARQTSLGRVVALKMIHGGALASEDDLKRFQREAEAAAGLDHAHIVPVYEVGSHAGQPYFSMRLVDGPSLAGVVAEDGPAVTAESQRRRAEWVASLARAVHYAHQRGVLHRDLKPHNVLLDPSGAPQLTDFGLAKRLTHPSDSLSQPGALVGTVEYMAPEQARGRSGEVTTATDLYGLGAILYELLTGRAPFKAATPFETLLDVVSTEPPRPRALNAALDHDLETICLKCLDKEASRRYASAAALADDLERWLRGETIEARPAGLAERGWRWCRRNPAVASLLAAVAASLLLGSTIATTFGLMASAEAEKARISEGKAQDEKREAEKQRDRAEQLAYAGQIDRALAYWRENNVTAAAQLRDASRWDLRDWEHRYLHTLFDHSHVTLGKQLDEILCVAVSPDGGRLASASGSRVQVWDARTGKEVIDLKGHEHTVTAVAFSPDGVHLASASRDETVRVWDLATGQTTFTLRGHTSYVTSVCYSPDGTRIASASSDIVTHNSMNSKEFSVTIVVWDARTGQQVRTLKGHEMEITAVAFASDGMRIASASRDHTARVWDLRTGREALKLGGHQGALTSVAVSPDGTRVATAAEDRTARVWDAATGRLLFALAGHAGAVRSVAFGPDGTQLATAADDGTVRLWDAQSGQETRLYKGHRDKVTSVAFHPEGSWVASAGGGRDRTVRLWDSRNHQEALVFQGDDSPVTSVAFHPDGTRLATAAHNGSVRAWDACTGRAVLTYQEKRDHRVTSLAFSPDGERLAAASDDTTVRVWNVQTGQETLVIEGRTVEGLTYYVTSLCFRHDGTQLAGACHDGAARVWDARSGREIRAHHDTTRPFQAICYHPTGFRLLATSTKGTAHVWDLDSGNEALALWGFSPVVCPACFAPDGTRLAIGSYDGTMRVWELQAGREPFALKGHVGPVTAVSFSPDGTRIASASLDKTLRLWDARTGRETLVLKGLASPVTCAAFSPDGLRLASGGRDGMVRLWEARAKQDALTLDVDQGPIDRIAFAPDGIRIIAELPVDRVTKCWNAVTGQEISPCPDDAPPPCEEAVSPDGARVVRFCGTDGCRLVVEPRAGIRGDDTVVRRLFDPLMDIPFRLEQLREARKHKDAFAVAFHLRPLLLAGFAQSAARPRDTFPLWAQRPLLARDGGRAPDRAFVATPAELARLEADLSKGSAGWDVVAARGWVRHLRGNVEGAIDDLRKAQTLKPDEPMLWAVLGSVCLHHGREKEAEESRQKLRSWPGLFVAAWHVAEAHANEANDDEAANDRAAWHRKHLAK